jgi:hypothetical protein
MGEDHASARLQGGAGDGVLIGLAGEEAAPGPAPSPQRKVAYGTGRRFGGWGCLVQCDSIHRTRGSGPGGDTGSTNPRT